MFPVDLNGRSQGKPIVVMGSRVTEAGNTGTRFTRMAEGHQQNAKHKWRDGAPQHGISSCVADVCQLEWQKPIAGRTTKNCTS